MRARVRSSPSPFRSAASATASRLALVGVSLLVATPASAGWSSTGSGGGAASARVLPTGNTPTASTGLGSVTVTWAASSFVGGGAVPSYVVRRVNTASGGGG